MEKRAFSMENLFLIAVLVLVLSCSSFHETVAQTSLFDNSFIKTCPETHFSASADGQTWYLSLDNSSGCGFETKEKYRFGWFSMKLKLAGGDSAGVVTAYYMCSDCSKLGAGPERDEIDFEFLGNVTGQPYIVQTNIYKNGTGGREMRHFLWFDPTEDYHTSIPFSGTPTSLCKFFVDRVPIRVFRNANYTNNFFPVDKPMSLLSSIWNADDWATRGGLDKTNWKLAPFVSSYKDFSVDACKWEDPYPACVATTTENWWDQYPAWHLSDDQKLDHAWVQRNLVIYDYCKDSERYPKLPEDCWISPYA